MYNQQRSKIMKKYRVYTEYTFSGYYDVVAETKEEAKRMVTENCGLVMGGNIQTTHNDEEVPYWDFDTHPEENIREVSFVCNVKDEEEEL